MNKFLKTIKRMTCLTVCLLMVFTGSWSEDLIPPKETPQAEMEVNMPNIPKINIGGTEYNIKDEVGRTSISDTQKILKPSKETLEKLLSDRVSETAKSYATSYSQVWYVPGLGNQSKDGWQCFYYTVNAGEIYRIKAENYNASAEAIVCLLKSGGGLLGQYADATDRIIIIPEGVSNIIVNRNWRYSPEAVVTKCSIKDFTELTTYYDKIQDRARVELITSKSAFGPGSVSGNVITVTGQNGGMATNQFTADSNVVAVDVDISTNFSNAAIIAIQLAVVKKNSGGTSFHILGSFNTSDSNVYKELLTFDAASYNVYENAESYYIVVNSVNTGNTGTITLNKFSVYESSALQQMSLYNSNFISMMENIMSKIQFTDSEIEAIQEESKTFIADSNGHHYSLNVSTNGVLSAIPNIPSDVIFIGNSILLGLGSEHGGAFGMAATDYTKDFSYLVEQEILKYNPSCAFIRQHCASFEMGDWENYINTYRNLWTNKDLIVCQIGDNVNTSERAAIFKNHFDDLVKSFKTLSPNARIVIVGVWFGAKSAHDTMSLAAKKYGCIYIDIADLCVSENFATVGETITYKDGTTGTMEQAWVSHPGNTGMQKIADRIIDKLDMW